MKILKWAFYALDLIILRTALCFTLPIRLLTTKLVHSFLIATFSVLVSFGIFSSSAFASGTYASTSILATITSSAKTWVDVKSDRAIQVTSVETVDRITANNEFAKSVEARDGELKVVYMTLKNTGQESGNMMWTTFQLIDSQGRKYNPISDIGEIVSIDMWLEEKGIEEPSTQMFPGGTVKTAKVFRVAPDASDLKLLVNNEKYLNVS